MGNVVSRIKVSANEEAPEDDNKHKQTAKYDNEHRVNDGNDAKGKFERYLLFRNESFFFPKRTSHRRESVPVPIRRMCNCSMKMNAVQESRRWMKTKRLRKAINPKLSEFVRRNVQLLESVKTR
jgi:hypothetical protein